MVREVGQLSAPARAARAVSGTKGDAPETSSVVGRRWIRAFR